MMREIHMKTRSWLVVGSLAVAVIAAGLSFGRHVLAQPYGGAGFGPGMMWGEGYGPGWGGGPGFYGEGYGPMWGRHGGWGGGPGFDAYSQLPADKRTQLRDLTVEHERKIVGLRAAMQELRLAQFQAMQKFPLDRDAAAKAWQGMDGLRKQMLDARLDYLAKAQQIVGKDLWAKIHEEWSPGWGGRRAP